MAWDGEDRSVAGLRATNGGLVPRAVGCTFAGKIPGTWRRITALGEQGVGVAWVNERGKTGYAFVSTFLGWIDRSRLVARPGEALDCDILRSTIKMLRDKGYSKEQIAAALGDA